MTSKVTYKCWNCKYEFKKEYKGWYPTTPCPKCGSTSQYSDMDTGGNLFFKKYKDVVAYGYDKATGQPVWLDKRGNALRHDDPSVRYNLDRDPHGWKATGHKVRVRDQKGRPNR